MPAVTGVSGMKNGYRTPSSAPVYDPNSYTGGQQRTFLYTNGTTIPQTMPTYPNQVVYVRIELQQIPCTIEIRSMLYNLSKLILS